MCTFKYSYELLSKTDTVLVLCKYNTMRLGTWYLSMYSSESQCFSNVSINISLNFWTLFQSTQTFLNPFLLSDVSWQISNNLIVPVCALVLDAVFSYSVLWSLNAPHMKISCQMIGTPSHPVSRVIQSPWIFPPIHLMSSRFEASKRVPGRSPLLLIALRKTWHH